jgi:hypothetical protein
MDGNIFNSQGVRVAISSAMSQKCRFCAEELLVQSCLTATKHANRCPLWVPTRTCVRVVSRVRALPQ